MANDSTTQPPLRLPLFAGSIAAALLLGEAAHGQTQEPAKEPPKTVKGVLIKSQPPQGYKADAPAIVKLTQPIIDTPQMINVTTRQVMDDRMATSLTDVFRNTSSISIGAGESSWQGTNLSLRGFNARNDMYLDGMRDFGSYTRDPFDLDTVEVLEGPSSILFGRGSTGGVVNQVSRQPQLGSIESGEITGGTDDLIRGTVDVNGPVPQLGDTAAFRIDAMGHSQDFTDRDKVHDRRWGVAPSFAWGLGTDTRIVLSYLHQSEDDLPDYGIPYFRGLPAPVPRNNFYGFTSDFLQTDVDVGTARFEHDFSPDLTIRDQVRYANYWRNWRDMEPQVITTGVTLATPLSAINVNRALQGGVSTETFAQNQMDLIGDVRLGGIEHDFSAGWEIGPESSEPTYNNGIGVPPTSLLHPNENQVFSGLEVPAVTVRTTAFTVGVYGIDTIKLGEHLELTGGVRWDRFDSHYVAQFFSTALATLGQPTRRQDVHELDQKPSWRASIVYKPVPFGSIYFDYSTSFNPSAEQLSQIVAVRSFNTGNIGLAPEDNETFEVGTKWDLLGERLQLQSALFQEVKENARETDPANTQFNILAGTQRVNGAEIIADGNLTEAWNVSASYTYLLGRTTKSVTGGPPVGSPIFNAPQNSVALWTTYQLPYRVQIGGGLNYLSRRYAAISAASYTSAPEYTVLDAMVKWQATDHLRLQVNVSNFTNAYYIDAIHGFHAIPGEGATALFSIAYTR
jgi:catecholate siderophore receptor